MLYRRQLAIVIITPGNPAHRLQSIVAGDDAVTYRKLLNRLFALEGTNQSSICKTGHGVKFPVSIFNFPASGKFQKPGRHYNLRVCLNAVQPFPLLTAEDVAS